MCSPLKKEGKKEGGTPSAALLSTNQETTNLGAASLALEMVCASIYPQISNFWMR